MTAGKRRAFPAPRRAPLALMALLVLLTACHRSRDDAGGGQTAAARTTLRVGHFPNITHAQALVASQLSRQGKGWFEERLGPGVKIEWFVYNAGPSAMEALLADSIDLTYTGPNPVLTAYAKTGGEDIRVVAGAATGGAALVVQEGGKLLKPADFKGAKLATPQLGNTQDVACRVWLKQQGFHVTQVGGDVLVVPTANPEQLTLFERGTMDGVWTVEPWVSRLELEAKGRVFLEQRDALTTVLAASAKALETKRELVKRFAQAHAELTEWVNAHPEEAKALVRAELKALTRRDFPAATADRAWPRLHFTSETSRPVFDALVAQAQSVGFLEKIPDLSRLIEKP